MTHAEQQAQRLVEQARTINEQAQRISDLYALLQKALVHAPQYVKVQVAERLSEMNIPAK